MGLIKEFREFALKGNMLDLAVGIIIGAAFGGVVNSLVADVIMPVVGIAGKVDFTNQYIALNDQVRAAEEAARAANQPFGLAEARKTGPVLAYGNFVTVVLNFLILAAAVFLVVKVFNAARRRFEAEKAAAPAPAAGPTKEEQLLTEIRDLLAKRA